MPTRPIRLGVHGSPHLAHRIVSAAGRRPSEVEFIPYDVTEPFRPLREGRCDLLLVKYTPGTSDLVLSRPVAFDGRALVVSAAHPLADRETVSIEEAAPYDVFRCPGDFPPEVWDAVVPPRTPAGLPLRRVHPVSTLDALVDTLATSRAVHVSFQSVAAVLPPGARAVPVHDLPDAPVTLGRWRGTEPPPAVREFVAAAEAGAA